MASKQKAKEKREELEEEKKSFGGGGGGGAGTGPTDETRGKFDEKKGGFVSADGKFYPTTNPKFVPKPDTEQIEFLGSGGVRISPAGSNQKIELTKEEYAGSMGKAGFITPETEKLEAERAISPEQRKALGRVGDIPGMQEQGKTLGEKAITAGTFLGGAAVGAKAGATGGAMFGPLGAAGGAVIGAVIGGFGALTWDQRQSTKEAFNNYQNAKSSISTIISNLNSGAIDPVTAAEMYNRQVAIVYSAERALKKKTNNAVGRQLSAAMDELADVQAYKTLLAIYEQNLRLAITNPNPNLSLGQQVATQEQ